jgi:hypothetical protein
LSKNWEGTVVLIIRAASLKKNLLRDYVVADKHRGIDTGVLRHTTITPVELAFDKGLLIPVGPIGIGATGRATGAAAGATRCARGGVGHTSTSIAAARAKTVASNVNLDTRAASRAAVGALDAARVGEADIGWSARREGTRLVRARVPDHGMLHVVKGKNMAGVDVSEKFLISFLVARCHREKQAHQDDEGKDVAHRHVVHVAKLRYVSVDASDVLRACFRGVVGEHKTLLETAGEELVRDGGTCQGVQEKNFGPGS